MPPMSELESSNLASAYRICIESLCALDAGTFEQLEPQLLHHVQRQRDERSFYSRYVLDLRVTLAYCYLNIGLQDDALDVIRDLMNDYTPQAVPGRLAQEGEYIVPLMELAISHQIYPEFAESVLALLRPNHKPQPLFVSETGETLTVREVEILRLLIEGASNQQIADTCVISIPTVKTHVSRILQKLAVSSRTQAVAKAHELRLL
ncbi:MAG: response regulator transcription factor [Anaerolineae bacterium]|nr:response regulator transcription factor [Anaerolineae bacterium]